MNMKIKKPRVFLGRELEGQKNRLRISHLDIKNFTRTPDYIFWMCHGINFLNSDFKEGIWNPVFDFIYNEDTTRLENFTITDMLNAIGGERLNQMSGRIALWAVQQPIVLFELNTYSKKKPSLRNPADSEMWAYFHNFITALMQKHVDDAEFNKHFLPVYADVMGDPSSIEC